MYYGSEIAYATFTITLTVNHPAPTPAVTAVTVSPATATITRGYQRQFTASVTRTGNASQTVTWSVTGNTSNLTTISATGLLTVASNETSSTLTVRATSTFAPAVFGTAMVTTVAPEQPSWSPPSSAPPVAPRPRQTVPAIVALDDPVPSRLYRFTASFLLENEADELSLYRIDDMDLPEDFVDDMLLRDGLNALFLLEEMHSFAVISADDEAAADIYAVISVYVGDLFLTDEQLLTIRGFAFDPETETYTIIHGFFSNDDAYFNFLFAGPGIIGVMFYELPAPILRLVIDQYAYVHNDVTLTSDVAPFITANRTMVPLRLVSEALGTVPQWYGPTQTVTIVLGGNVLSLTVGEELPGGMGVPVIRNDRVLVPIRFVMESFDAITLWYAAGREVTVFVR